MIWLLLGQLLTVDVVKAPVREFPAEREIRVAEMRRGERAC